MSNIFSFDYDTSYDPSAPFLPVTIDGYDSKKSPVTVLAFVDSGADGTMMPRDLLEAIGVNYEDTVHLHGTAGGTRQLDRYVIRVRIEGETIHAVSALATTEGSEPLIGRDVLNQLVVTLNGLAGVTEVEIK